MDLKDGFEEFEKINLTYHTGSCIFIHLKESFNFPGGILFYVLVKELQKLMYIQVSAI